MKNIFLIFVLMACCGCPSPVVPPAPPIATPEPNPHVTPVSGADKCNAACDHITMIACEESKPVAVTDGGIMSCADFCQYQHANGVYWNTDCLTQVKTCSEIETVCNIK